MWLPLSCNISRSSRSASSMALNMSKSRAARADTGSATMFPPTLRICNETWYHENLSSSLHTVSSTTKEKIFPPFLDDRFRLSLFFRIPHLVKRIVVKARADRPLRGPGGGIVRHSRVPGHHALGVPGAVQPEPSFQTRARDQTAPWKRRCVGLLGHVLSRHRQELHCPVGRVQLQICCIRT